MTEPDFVDVLGPALAGALEGRGFTSLTPVQKTVLDPDLAGRDLRITSQTGSGKTVAIGFILRDLASREANKMGGVAHPYAIIVAPTRELAKQVDEELTWLFAEVGTRVVSVTGGTSARDERRALAHGPQIVVGTPGRLLDHLDRGAIDADEVAAVVLDEADRLLDMGFREELDAIFARMPEERRTHLVSATFPREVRALADAVQSDAALVEGTRLGEANADIEHVLHLVDGRDRLNAVINLLLANPDEQTLVFARTRADVAEIADALAAAGFATSSLSGEMEQPQRDRALAAFKRGDLRVLVATDVAARGIDVQDIARVIHADPPGDADTYTHRSGRTGRAGNKGISSTLVPPSIMAKVLRLLHRAGVKYRFEKIPSADDIRKKQDDHMIAELTRDPAAATSDETGPATEASEAEVERAAADNPRDATAPSDIDPRAQAIAERLVAAGNVSRTLARLLMRLRQSGPEPRHVRPIEPPTEAGRPSRRSAAAAAPVRARHAPTERAPRARAIDADASRETDRIPPQGAESEQPVFDSQRPPPSSRGPRDLARPWTLFQITWGDAHGADSRRMLAMLCRRGGVESRDVGSIRIGRVSSTVEIASDVADHFAEAAGKIDSRDPRIVIRPFLGSPDRPRAERPPFEPRRGSDRPPFEPRRGSERPPFEPRRGSERPPFEPRRGSDRPPFEPRASERPPFERRGSDRPPFEPRATPGKKPFAKKPFAKPRPAPELEGAAPDAAPRERAPRLKALRERIAAPPSDLPKKGWVKKPHVARGDAPPKRRSK